MISTTEIVIIVFLFITLGVAIWWYGVAYNYGETLSSFAYTRGANIDTGTFGQGNSGKGVVDMNCDSDREICVWRATSICTGAENQFNVEGGVEPISNGINNSAPYGNFDPKTTVDLTKSLSALANGNQSYTYNFDGSKLSYGGKVCPLNYNQSNGTGQRPQLIATYTCIPKGSVCKSA